MLRKFAYIYDVSAVRQLIFFDKIGWLLERTDDIKRDMSNPDVINKIFKEIKETKNTQGKNKGKPMSDANYATIVSVCQRFVKWLNDDVKPKGFKDIKTCTLKKIKRTLDEDDMVTWKDAEKLINATNSMQTKAIIATQLDGVNR